MDKGSQNFQEIQTTENSESRVMIPPYRHFGLTIPVKWMPNGEPKYLLGPQYLTFFLTLLITSIGFTILGLHLISSAQANQLIISLSIGFSLVFYIYSYVKVGFSNPGIASSSHELEQQSRKNVRYCVPCKIIRPFGTVHCYSCDVCIHGYDHHCPWIGKCVGKENMCSFKLFLFSIFLAIGVFAWSTYVSSESNQKMVKNVAN